MLRWGILGVSLELVGGLLGPRVGAWGHRRVLLGRLAPVMAVLGPPLGRLGALEGRVSLLGCFWALATSGPLGPLRGPLGKSSGLFGCFLGRILGAS